MIIDQRTKDVILFFVCSIEAFRPDPLLNMSCMERVVLNASENL